MHADFVTDWSCTEVYEGLLTAAATDEATFSATRALPIILEIVPLGMNKAVAVKQICEMLGTTPEKCLAFGDGDNDKVRSTQVSLATTL